MVQGKKYFYAKVQGENVLYAKVQGDKVLLHPGAGGTCIFTRVAGAARSRPKPRFLAGAGAVF